MKNKKTLSNLIALSILVALLSFFGAVFYFKNQMLAVDPTSKTTKSITIVQGEGVSQIADILKSQNLIKDPLVFKIYVKIKNFAPNLQAGDYLISPSQSLSEIVETIRNGRTEDIKITIPEGLRREEIANYLQNTLSRNMQIEFMQKSKGLEGKLFPDTYFIKKDTTADEIVKKMTTNFDAKFNKLINSSTNSLSQYQTIILASMVEREVKQDKDRPLVAGILLKRLKNNWPLEVDATVQYAIGFDKLENSWWKKTLTADDLQIDSPYNTRINPGLPPEAICNPGLASLKAAVNPQDSPYWFYLSDNQGIIHYSQTLEEHEQNSNKNLDK